MDKIDSLGRETSAIGGRENGPRTMDKIDSLGREASAIGGRGETGDGGWKNDGGPGTGDRGG
jgi:hypothetical protein